MTGAAPAVAAASRTGRQDTTRRTKRPAENGLVKGPSRNRVSARRALWHGSLIADPRSLARDPRKPSARKLDETVQRIRKLKTLEERFNPVQVMSGDPYRNSLGVFNAKPEVGGSFTHTS